MTEFLHILPWAILACLLIAAVELGVLKLLEHRSPMITITVLVTVPLAGVLIFVIMISGFMFTEQLRWTLITCALIGITVIPLSVVLGRAMTRRQLEAEGRRADERAAERSRRDLVAWMSHDLRTPMSGIQAMSEALEDGLVTEAGEVADYGQRIGKEVGRLGAMVDDLFELSKIASGTLAVQLADVALDGIVGHVVEGLGPAARRKGVRLEVAPDPPASTWPAVVGSGAELDRVLRNLVVNAIRHTPVRGVVSVSILPAVDHVCLVVEDACGGIAAEDLSRVFEVAYRGSRSRSPQQDNSAGLDARAGLGLAIVRGLVEAQHGEVAVTNSGPGCRFEVKLARAG